MADNNPYIARVKREKERKAQEEGDKVHIAPYMIYLILNKWYN